MLIFKISPDDIKVFMNQLLISDTFYEFSVSQCEVDGLVNVKYDGSLETKISDDNDTEVFEDQEPYIGWETLQPFILNFIQGNKKPNKILITFILPKNKNNLIHENISSCILNMRFINDEVVFTTSIIEKNFSLDNSISHIWSEYVSNFFSEKSTPVIIENI